MSKPPIKNNDKTPQDKKRTKADVYVGVAGPHRTDIQNIRDDYARGKVTLEHEAWYYGMSVEDLKLLCDLD